MTRRSNPRAAVIGGLVMIAAGNFRLAFGVYGPLGIVLIVLGVIAISRHSVYVISPAFLEC